VPVVVAVVGAICPVAAAITELAAMAFDFFFFFGFSVWE
jgi:hypothetical protein